MTTFKISPLEQRIYRSKAKGIMLPSPIKVLCRPKAYGLWTRESLDQAAAAVERGTSVRRAAEMFGVPHFIVHDHASGKVKSLQNRVPYPTTEEEKNFYSKYECCHHGRVVGAISATSSLSYTEDSCSSFVCTCHGFQQ